MNKDQLTTCPKCKCDGCYVTPINEIQNAFYCWGCGFQTSDLLKEGEFDLEEYQISLPEIYKDLQYVDEEGRHWFPVTITIPKVGSVFIGGKSVEEAQWTGILMRPATEEEKQKLAGKGIEYLSDINSIKKFDNFIDACEYVGVFKLQ